MNRDAKNNPRYFTKIITAVKVVITAATFLLYNAIIIMPENSQSDDSKSNIHNYAKVGGKTIMSMRPITLNPSRRAVCAFCRYWYDVTNQHIKPKNAARNMWEYDPQAKCKCMKTNLDKYGYTTCPKYECKVNVN